MEERNYDLDMKGLDDVTFCVRLEVSSDRTEVFCPYINTKAAVEFGDIDRAINFLKGAALSRFALYDTIPDTVTIKFSVKYEPLFKEGKK